MCHNLRDRELLAEEARKPRAVSNRPRGRERGHSESAREGLAATEVQEKPLTEEVREVVGRVGWPS